MVDSVAWVVDSVARVVDSVAWVVDSVARVVDSVAWVVGSVAWVVGSVDSVVGSLSGTMNSAESTVCASPVSEAAKTDGTKDAAMHKEISKAIIFFLTEPCDDIFKLKTPFRKTLDHTLNAITKIDLYVFNNILNVF